MKIRLALIDNDKNYLEKFLFYMNKYFSDKLEIHIFNDNELLYKNLKDERIEVLLLGEDIAVNIDFLDADRLITARFLSSNIVCNEKFVFKYQSIELIFLEILNIYSEMYKFLEKTSGAKALGRAYKIITALSSGSGAGASTVALALALRLAEKGKKVFFLDLQELATSICVLSGNGKFTLSDIIYSIKSERSNLTGKIQSSIRYDKSGVSFIEPCKNPLERSELNRELVLKFMGVLTNDFDFDYIIIDYNFGINEVCYEMLRISDTILCFSDGLKLADAKLDAMIFTIQLMQKKDKTDYFSKIRVVYNKFMDNVSVCRSFEGINTVIIKKYGIYEPRALSEYISKNEILDELYQEESNEGVI